MAGPKSFSPLPRAVPKTTRRFSVREANRAIPLVWRIVRDIVNTHDRADQLQARLEQTPLTKESVVIHEDLQKVLHRLGEYVQELTDIGCELKDYRSGLVDFVGRHQGRDICLCWRLGEESITSWHELHAGYAGRQPVADLEEDQ